MGRQKPGWKTGGKPQGNDITSCRGHGIFLATCQSARERETSRELVTLITDTIEDIYPMETVPVAQVEEQDERTLSVEELIRREVAAAKGGNQSGKNNAHAQKAVSISTDVKGIVIIKLMKKRFCPVRILSHIMEKIERERSPLTRYVVRLIPLQITFFPKDDELAYNIPYLLHPHLPGIELPHLQRQSEGSDEDGDEIEEGEEEAPSEKSIDDDEAAVTKRQRTDEAGTAVPTADDSTPAVVLNNVTYTAPPSFQKFRYCIEYKGRNHNVLSREKVFVMFNQRLREFGAVDYMNPEVSYDV